MVNPALQALIDKAMAETVAMVSATIASGQHTLVGGYATERDALNALPVGTCFQAVRNIAGKWSHA